MDPLPLLLPLFLFPGVETLEPAYVYTDGEAVMMDQTVGAGLAASIGDLVTVHYVLRQLGGKEIANSNLRGLPFSFVVDEGSTLSDVVRGMRIGGVREATFPAERLPAPDLVLSKGSECWLSIRLLAVRKANPK